MELIPLTEITISNKIRDWRKELSITQEALADAVGVSRQSIISLESGRCMPSVQLAMAISRVLNMSLEKIFVIDNENKNNQEDNMSRELDPRPWRHGLGDIDRMIDDAFSSPFRQMGHTIAPQMNIYQTEGEIVVEADVPGMTDKDVDIEISEGVLTIKGERKYEEEENKKEYFHREVSYGIFQRAVTLPVEIDAEKAVATVKRGQLKVVLPKIEPEKPKIHKVKTKSEE